MWPLMTSEVILYFKNKVLSYQSRSINVCARTNVAKITQYGSPGVFWDVEELTFLKIVLPFDKADSCIYNQSTKEHNPSLQPKQFVWCGGIFLTLQYEFIDFALLN